MPMQMLPCKFGSFVIQPLVTICKPVGFPNILPVEGGREGKSIQEGGECDCIALAPC